jgi:predicted TIM-barrel fold metal-dependent hydrolase
MIPRAYGECARLAPIPGSNKLQIIIEKPKGCPNLNYSELNTDGTNRIAVLDEGGVDKAILRIPCVEEWISLETAKIYNDMLAKTVREHPDRLLALAIVPPWSDDDCLYEVERCVKELGCCGVEMSAHYGQLYLDEEDFRPYFKKLNQLGVPVCVHHTPLPVEYREVSRYTNMRRGFGRIIDQMTSLGRVLYSDLLDEFPNLRFIYTMFGGAFYGGMNMIIPRKSTVKEEMDRTDSSLTDKILGRLKDNIYFDMCHAQPWGKDQLEFAIKTLGADHVLYASSYPVRIEWGVKGVEFVKNLDIDEKDKALILGGNAMRLFNIKP